MALPSGTTESILTKEPRYMELQHVNVKLLVKDPERVDLDPLVPVFHNWIQGQVFEGQLVDVADYRHVPARSEEHTSELQSHLNLVCRLLLEKKKRKVKTYMRLA